MQRVRQIVRAQDTARSPAMVSYSDHSPISRYGSNNISCQGKPWSLHDPGGQHEPGKTSATPSPGRRSDRLGHRGARQGWHGWQQCSTVLSALGHPEKHDEHGRAVPAAHERAHPQFRDSRRHRFRKGTDGEAGWQDLYAKREDRGCRAGGDDPGHPRKEYRPLEAGNEVGRYGFSPSVTPAPRPEKAGMSHHVQGSRYQEPCRRGIARKMLCTASVHHRYAAQKIITTEQPVRFRPEHMALGG
jgi:hypothetical protein